MNSKLEFWTTFILAFIGALAWIPNILDFLKTNKIEGKLISRYVNVNIDHTQTMFLFKLSIFSKNKPFDLKEISCEIAFENGEKFLSSARNNRLVVFTFETTYKLLLSGQDFINNYSFFPANENAVGYLFFLFEGNLDRKLYSTTFIFESFDGKVQKIKFQEQNDLEEQLFFDDTIWQRVNMKEIENYPAFKNAVKRE